MLDEVLRARDWPVVLSGEDRRESMKLLLCEVQTAGVNRGDSELAHQRSQLAREMFAQAAGGRGNG
jgi:hypothetical protein